MTDRSDPRFHVEDHEPIVPCKGCAKPIRWLKMQNGCIMCVDAEAVQLLEIDVHSKLVVNRAVYGSRWLEPGAIGYLPHWGSCARASLFKRDKNGQIPFYKDRAQ